MWGLNMQPNELLLALEEKELPVLDNQEVSDALAGGVQAMSLFGEMGQNVVEGSFADAMPDPSEDAIADIAMNHAFTDFTPPDDAPGMG